jgi:molybdenum cofactor cytidylyltransferase
MAIGVIILAAGGSSRMGTPKQLLLYRGESLIRHAAQVALGSVCDRVVVVIGSRADEMRNELADMPLEVIENPNWQVGMSSSIRAGLQALKSTNDLNEVVIMLCDQPFVNAEVLNDLVTTQRQTGESIVASLYGTTRGVPALFSRNFFDELMSLAADEGARRTIASHPNDVATVIFPQGAIDIDTPRDHDQLVFG